MSRQIKHHKPKVEELPASSALLPPLKAQTEKSSENASINRTSHHWWQGSNRKLTESVVEKSREDVVKATSQTTLPKVFRLLGLAWKDVWRAKFLILGIVLVVEVPAALLAGGSSATTPNTSQGYANLGAIFMEVALLLLFTTFIDGRPTIGIRRAYYEGSTYVVRFVLVSAVVVLTLAPAVFGVFVYTAGGLTTVNGGGTIGETIIFSALGIALTLPSVWLLMRFGLAPTIVVAGNLTPVAALKYSRELTQGRFWRLLGRLMSLMLMLVLILLVIATVISAINILFPASGVTGFLYDVLSVLITIPVANAYLVRLYTALNTSRHFRSKVNT